MIFGAQNQLESNILEAMRQGYIEICDNGVPKPMRVKYFLQGNGLWRVEYTMDTDLAYCPHSGSYGLCAADCEFIELYPDEVFDSVKDDIESRNASIII